MKYVPRVQTLEAVPVDLSGQRLMAVAIEGKAHLVDAELFDLLYVSERGHQEKAVPVSHRKVIIESKSPVKPKQGPAARRPSEVAQRCLNILREHGPLTSAELRGHVYKDEKDEKKRLQNFSALSLDMKRRGIIERREDPATHLDKWYLCEGAVT